MSSPYVLGRLLGEGGMGQVFEAEDTARGRAVAVKILHPAFLADPYAKERLLREAKAGSSFEHPHVARTYGIEEIDGRTSMVMELVRGESLRARVRRGPLVLEEAVRLGLQALDGLGAA